MGTLFIGIAGGSGAGKTALAKELKKHFGRTTRVLHLDEYQKFGEKLPKFHGMKNWDCPEAIKWNKLYQDLVSLKRKEEIVIVEGYLLFWQPAVRRLFNKRIYLEAGEETRIKRRTKFKNPRYVERVLLPMHEKYIEPTKKFANLVLNTERYSIKQCAKKIFQVIET